MAAHLYRVITKTVGPCENGHYVGGLVISNTHIFNSSHVMGGYFVVGRDFSVCVRAKDEMDPRGRVVSR